MGEGEENNGGREVIFRRKSENIERELVLEVEVQSSLADGKVESVTEFVVVNFRWRWGKITVMHLVVHCLPRRSRSRSSRGSPRRVRCRPHDTDEVIENSRKNRWKK